MDSSSMRALGLLGGALYFAVFLAVYFLLVISGVSQHITKYFMRRNYNFEPVIRLAVDIISFLIAAFISVLLGSALLKMGFGRKLLHLLFGADFN